MRIIVLILVFLKISFSMDRMKPDSLSDLKDYGELREKYNDTYLPKSLIKAMFSKSTIHKNNIIRVKAPSFAGTYAFSHALESVNMANKIVFKKEDLDVRLIDNMYSSNEKAFYGSDGRYLTAKIYPLKTDADRRHFVYFADAVYKDSKIKLGGYLFMDIQIDQIDDEMILNINSYFKIKNGFLNFFASSLKKISSSFNNWLNINIGQVTRYIVYLGRRVVLGYWNDWQKTK